MQRYKNCHKTTRKSLYEHTDSIGSVVWHVQDQDTNKVGEGTDRERESSSSSSRGQSKSLVLKNDLLLIGA